MPTRPTSDQETRRRTMHRLFMQRMTQAIGIWAALAVGGLIVGMAGYGYYEGMALADSFANAAMILSGMGPLGKLKTTGGKIFAGCYALLSGLIIIIATSFIMAPVFHRVLASLPSRNGARRLAACG